MCLPSSLSNIGPVLTQQDLQASAETQRAPRLVLGLLLASLIGIGSMTARASPPADQLVRAELIAEPQAIAPGQPFWVGVRLRLEPHDDRPPFVTPSFEI